MNALRLAVITLLVCTTALPLTAQETMTEKDKAQFGLAQSLNNTEKFSEASDILESLYKQFPDNEKIAKEYAKALGYSKGTDKAVSILKKLAKQTPNDEALTQTIASVLEAGQRPKEAREFYQELLKASPEDRQLLLKIAETSRLIGDHDTAQECYKKILEKNDDINVRLLAISSLYEEGKDQEAEDQLRTILQKDNSHIDVLLQIVQRLFSRKAYHEALGFAEKILEEIPNHKEGSLYKARILSLLKEYDEAIEVYDQLIELYPAWPTPLREKARVLGWDRQYSESNDAYEELIKTFGNQEIFELEARGKRNLYRRYSRRAIAAYSELIEKEPDNYEAMFDIAQLYAQEGLWKEAEHAHNRLLRFFPDSRQTMDSQNAVSLYSSAWNITGFIEKLEAKSNDRNVDKTITRNYFGIEKSFSENWSANVEYDFRDYDYNRNNSIFRHSTVAQLKWHHRPTIGASAGYAINSYNEEINDSESFIAAVDITPHDSIDLKLSYNEDDVDDNRETLLAELSRNRYAARADVKILRPLTAGITYYKEDYSDKNEKEGLKIDASCKILSEPRSLVVKLAHEEYDFDLPAEIYFSPQEFSSDEITLQWRHFLNKEELRWGSANTFYTLRYTYNVDINDEKGHTYYADLHHDWSLTKSTELQLSQTIYENENTYEELRAMIYVRIFL